MNQNITIHWDFTDGTELSYIEGKNSSYDFTTNCLDFFCADNINAKVVNKYGKTMTVRDLLSNNGFHTDKTLRVAHNFRKMLVGNAFNWE